MEDDADVHSPCVLHQNFSHMHQEWEKENLYLYPVHGTKYNMKTCDWEERELLIIENTTIGRNSEYGERGS